MRLLVFVAVAVATSFKPLATGSARHSHRLQDETEEALDWRKSKWELKQNGPCATTLDDGSQINLAWMTEGLHSSSLRAEGEGFVYTYNPCVGLECGVPGDRDGALCQAPNQGKNYVRLGLLSTAVFKINSSATPTNISIQYHNPARNLSSLVHLVCTPQADLHSSRLQVAPKINASFFQFQLLSPCACPNGCQPSSPRMSVGTILVLTFFSVTLLYFGIGFFFKKALSGAQGLQALPHSQFWTSLPGLIKDGYLFFISPCLGQNVEYKYYDRL